MKTRWSTTTAAYIYNHSSLYDVGTIEGKESWVAGYLDFNGYNPDNTNTEKLINHTLYPYGAYLGDYVKTPAVFKCPADHATVATAGGPRMNRVRSVSMNCRVGIGGHNYRVGADTGGPYPLYTKLTQIRLPTGTFVFLDERETINDGFFATDSNVRWMLVDYPAFYHNGAAGFSFSDGHSEIHRWLDPRTTPVSTPGTFGVSMPNNPDVDWLNQHAAGVSIYP